MRLLTLLSDCVCCPTVCSLRPRRLLVSTGHPLWTKVARDGDDSDSFQLCYYSLTIVADLDYKVVLFVVARGRPLQMSQIEDAFKDTRLVEYDFCPSLGTPSTLSSLSQ